METQAEQVGAIQRATFNDRFSVNSGPFSPILGYVLARRVVSEKHIQGWAKSAQY